MKIERIYIDTYRAPVTKPVVASFGTIPSRAMALVRVQDGDGAIGWGEIWGNFPTITTEHRARLAVSVLPGLLLGQTIDDIPAFHAAATNKLHVLAIQAGEPGPVAAILAAVDQALWDLAARKAGVPLRILLNPDASDSIPGYASGLNPDDGPEVVAAERQNGHSCFKQKIGFGEDVDKNNVTRIVEDMPAGERLFVDANQRWDLAQAIDAGAWLAEAGVGWLEEPMPADAPHHDWRVLKQAIGLPLAGAENLRGQAEMESAFGWFDFIQPDVGKWGGVSGCYGIATKAVAAGRTYCPHWLGGGIGLLHSAQLLAAAGGDGLLEMDVNENPLRDLTLGGSLPIAEGSVALPPDAGIGPAPDLRALEEWRVDGAVLG